MVNLNNLAGCVLATSTVLPPIKSAYEYVIAANGLFIRAEDSRMEAMVPVASAQLNGLADVEPYARLLVPKIGARRLEWVEYVATQSVPNEILFQLEYIGVFGSWNIRIPKQVVSAFSIHFQDYGYSVVDLHSHGVLTAFFSATDDADEQGFRFYAVIGNLIRGVPRVRCRVGVYGHHMDVPASTIFESIGAFEDLYGKDTNAESTD